MRARRKKAAWDMREWDQVLTRPLALGGINAHTAVAVFDQAGSCLAFTVEGPGQERRPER